jgi:hypothetical protein
MADNIFKRWTSKRVRELADSGASLSEIAEMLARTESATKARNEPWPHTSAIMVNKITWAQVGRVTEPGRYMFKFGWLTITADDLAIWEKYPNAAFTLYSTAKPPEPAAEDVTGEEFRLGAFEIRSDSNYSESEK